MSDAPTPASQTPPPHTTGGGFRWEPPTAEQLQALMPGYTIEKILGRGGMGAVYKGVQENLDRTVAIKILPPGVEKEDPSFADRFKSEARLMAKLNHPGVVAVYDFGKNSAGQLYFAMEYVDGTDVSKMIIEQKKLPADYALAITAHMCDALGAAHELGIVHRDIKPANVLLNMKGQVKIADFGLAKIEDPGQHGLTKTGYAMGTPDFVAPEALMLGTAIDGRADIYAVGVMLYQMLTGQIPRGAWQPASVLSPGTDARFDKIITKAMQYDRENRYQSAAELRADLDVILTVPLVQVDAPTGQSAIPAAEVAQAPDKRSKAQKSKGTTNTPVRRDTDLAGKLRSPEGNAHGTSQSPKSKTPLFIGLGAAAAIAIGAFVMLGGKKNSPSTGSAVSKSNASNSGEAWRDVLHDGSKIVLTEGVVELTTAGVRFTDAGSALISAMEAPHRDGAVRMQSKYGPSAPQVRVRGGNAKDAGLYQLWVANANSVTLAYWNSAAKQSMQLAKYPLSSHMQPGQEYELELRVVGQTLTAKLDGRTLGSVTDATLSEGRFGIGMSVKPGAPVTVHSFEVLDLDSASVAAASSPQQGSPTPATAASSPQWTPVNLSKLGTLDDGKKIRRVENGVLHLAGAGGAAPKDASFRNGAIRFTCLWGADFQTMDASLRAQTGSKIAARIRVNDLTFIDLKDGAKGKPAAGSPIKTLDLPKTLKAGAEPVFEFAAVGVVLYAWCDGQLLGQAPTTLLAEGGIGFQASGIGGKIKNIEYLNLDGLSEPEALKVLGLDAKSPAVPAPMPVATAPSSPSPPASTSSDKFPPGQWTKVFTKFEDLSQKARNEYKLTWKDGWIDGTTSPEGYQQLSIPNTKGQNQGVRARIKYDPKAPGTYPGSLALRTSTGQRYTLNYNFADHSARIALAADKTIRALSTQTPKQVPPDGSEFELEFYAIGDRLIGRMNGELLPIGTDDSLAEGHISFSVKHLMRDIEAINLDGLSEAEALKLAGVDAQGKDLRAPAAPMAAVPASPSPTATQSPAFPPGQWVKLFSPTEPAPSGAVWKDGWLEKPNGPCSIPDFKAKNMGFRVTFKDASKVSSNNYYGGLKIRGNLSGSANVMRVRHDGVVECGYEPVGKDSDPDAHFTFLGEKGKIEVKPAEPMKLEFAAVGTRLFGRINDVLVIKAEDPDARFNSARVSSSNPFGNIEVINLDGLSEAEALKILGVDEKGNDLRAAAVAQEKQAMEQAKSVDAMAAIPEMKALHDQLVKLTAERVTAPFAAEVAKLNAGYLGGIDREIASEKKAGHLDGIIALEAEKKLIAEQLTVPAEDAADTTASLKKLRGIYRAAYAKFETTRTTNLKALTDPLTARLKLLEADLTKKDRVNDAKQVKAYREDLGKSAPQGTAVTPNPTPTPISAATTTKEEAKNVRSALPSGVLHTAGVFQDIPIDLSKFGDLNGFVQVTCGPSTWAALRANGTVVSSNAAIHGLKDIESVNYTSQGLAVIPRGKKGIVTAKAGQLDVAGEIEPASYGGGKVVDAAMAGQGNVIILKDDHTIRLIGPNFPASKTLQETKGITDVVAVTATGTVLAALDAKGKVYAWGWTTPKTDAKDAPAYAMDTSMMPADGVAIAAGKLNSLTILGKAGRWESYGFQTANSSFKQEQGGALPANWVRVKGFQSAVVNADGSWTALENPSADLAPLLPKDRRVLDISLLSQNNAKQNIKSACVLWIEPPESAAPKAAP